MERIGEKYLALKENIKDIASSCNRSFHDIKLIAISKNHSIEEILQVYRAGCRDFGENRIQEALTKICDCPKDINWHLVGSLQNNKVNKAAGSFSLIHSVDSLALAKKISEASARLGIISSILLQVNVSGEASKHGLNEEEWRRNLDEVNRLPNLKLEGLMTMAPLNANEREIRACFAGLRELKERFIKEVNNPYLFRHLSMGMSNDYHLAIQEGATLLRIGTALFK